MASPLDIVGVDRPLGGAPASPVQYQGANILSTANDSMQRTLQNASQSLQQQQRTQESITQSALQASKSETNAQLLEAQAKSTKAQQPNGIASLSAAVQEYLKLQKQKEQNDYQNKVNEQALRSKEEAARAKAAAEVAANEEYLNAFSGLQNLYVNWRDNGGEKSKEGIGGLRYEGVKYLSSFGKMNSEQRMNLTKELYGWIESHQGERIKAYTEEAKKQQNAIQAQAEAEYQAKASFTISEIEKSVYTNPTEAMGRFNGIVAGVMSDKRFTETERLEIATGLMKNLLPKLDQRNSNYLDVQQKLTNAQEYGRIMVDVYNDSTLSPEQKQIKLDTEKVRLGFADKIGDLAPGMAQEQLIQHIENDKKLRELQQSNVIEDAKALKLSNASQGFLAANFLKNPTLLKMVENDPLLKNSPGGQMAVELGKNFEGDRLKVQQLFSQRINLMADIQNMSQDNFVFWLRQNAANNPDVKDLLGRNAILYGLIQSPGLQMTEEQKQELKTLQQSIAQTTGQRAGIIDQQIRDLQSKYSTYGLDLNKSVDDNFQQLKHRQAAYTSEVNAYQDALKARQQQPQLGVSSPNPTNGSGSNVRTYDPKRDGGWLAPGTKTLHSISWDGSDGSKAKAVLPFSPEDSGKIKIWEEGSGNTWGAARPSRPKGSGKEHVGLDIAAPEGTKMYSYIAGRVVHAGTYDDYGYTVDILGDDGMLHRFAHLQAGSMRVRKGDTVFPGTYFGNVGQTGRSEGAHLHWEVRDPNKQFGFDGTVNPTQYVASLAGKDSTAPRPRGSGDGWSYKADTTSYRVPQNALVLPGGRYYLNGKIGTLEAPETPVQDASAMYHPAKPLNTGYASNRATDYDNDPENTHNYKILSEDHAFRKKLNSVASELGIPGQWLADLMAFETGGTFSPSVRNGAGSGAVGLIQFMPSTLKDMGYTVQQAASMNRTQQLDLVKRYLEPMKGYLNRGAEYVLMAVWGGAGNLEKLAKGQINENISDGSITFREYASRLGSHAGRRYGRNQAARRERLTSTTHTSYVSGCKTCEALRQAGGTVIPHVGQTGEPLALRNR